VTTILGLSAFYHDSAAALVRDGEIVAAAQEERFTRVKHDHRFPKHAIDYCLAEAGITATQLDHVAFYDKPILKFERLLRTYLGYAPLGIRSFMKALPLWLRQKLFLPREIDRGLGDDYQGPLYFTGHHEAHAASAFFPSPFEEAAILTLDGVGEWSTASWGVGRGNRVELKQEIRFPHSLGLLYSAVTYYTGFKVNTGEYKVMGLAPYGEPKYVDLFWKHIIDLKDDGSFWLDMKYFDYCAGLTMTSRKFHDLFGGPPRKPEARLTQREMDLAASVQKVCEEVMLRIANSVHAKTGMKHLCLAGGVALNCVGNGRILREGPFEKLWIQPAAGDAGGALGAALVVWHHILEKPRTPDPLDSLKGSMLGPRVSTDQVVRYLDSIGAKYRRLDDERALCDEIAGLLDGGKVIGLVQGRMEFGPRALGNRSIIGDARNTSMQATMNLKVKFRESFRPFAPSVLEEDIGDYFELAASSPYMLLVAPVRTDRRQPMTAEQEKLFGIDKLNVPRSDIPAVTHIDYSARVQSVDARRSPRYHAIIDAFKRRTGYGVIVNTSFNIRGEPIVNTPADAYRCFMFTDMDALVLEDCLLLKADQPPMAGAAEYRAQFELD
jgi:carbamoyltransferase